MINFVSIIDADDKPLVIECNTCNNYTAHDGVTSTTKDKLAWQVKYHKLTNMSLDYFQSEFFQPTGRQGEQYLGYFKLFQLSRCIVYGHHVWDTGMKFVIGISEQDNTNAHGQPYTEMDIKLLFSKLQELYTQTKINPFSTDLSKKKKNQSFEQGKQMLAQHIRTIFF